MKKLCCVSLVICSLQLRDNSLIEILLSLVPKDVEELLIPSPVNDKQKFYNYVIHTLHKESFSLMIQDPFLQICLQPTCV